MAHSRQCHFRLSHRLGDDDVAEFGIDLFGTAENRVDVGELDPAPGFSLKMVPLRARVYEPDVELRA